VLKAGSRPKRLEDFEPDSVETTPSGLPLMDHQRRAVTFLRHVDPLSAGALLGADIGSGKSIAALQSLWLDGFLQQGGVIIGPKAALDTWTSEDSDARVHYSLVIEPIVGQTVTPGALQSGKWYFCHYDILDYWQTPLFTQLKPSSIIIDESQDLCNPRSRRHLAGKNLANSKCIQRRVLLSGSPVPKDRLDLYGQLAIAQPLQWGKVFDFGVRYAGGHKEEHAEDAAHWVFDGRTRTLELQDRLAGVYLRYTKAQIKEDLPTLERHRLDISLDEETQRKYHLALTDILKYRKLEQGETPLPNKISFGGVEYKVPKKKPLAAGLIITSTLKSIRARAKLPWARDKILDLLETGHQKILVGTWRRQSAKTLMKDLDDIGVPVFGPATGNMDWDKRIELAKGFSRADGPAVYVCTRGAVKYSINRLSCADACLQVTPDWNPDSNLQFEGRIHRKGNPHKVVHSYYMLVPGTLDDRILELLLNKGEEAKGINETDQEGYNLAMDLDPTGSMADSWSVDEICALLPEIEAF
jgi:SNF2 family DNA or RNA helicase